jgi:cytochrome b subunit of formate dehydrogenase
MRVAAIPPLPETIYRKNGVIIMEFANSVVNLIGNIICLGILVTFLIGLIYGIKFMIQAKTQDKEEYERKKEKDELERKETELRYQKMLEDRR